MSNQRLFMYLGYDQKYFRVDLGGRFGVLKSVDIFKGYRRSNDLTFSPKYQN